ncbi:uncharacterized protein [Diadema antillarum]|uniref:uncharacterized protein n=1 Tax=Diadema antillarum TaxID=105358 RepID=UPI003A8500B2
MAGSGGSYEDDFEEGSNGFSDISPRGSHGLEGLLEGDVFSPEPVRSTFLTNSSPGNDYDLDFKGQESARSVSGEEEDDEVTSLTPRRKIVGNGFERPIHRQSLQEFENLERLLKEQSQGSADGEDMKGRSFPGEKAGFRQDYDGDSRNGNMTDQSDDIFKRGHNESLEDGTEFDGMLNGDAHRYGDDDMMKYMEATPRDHPDVAYHPGGRPYDIMDNLYDNDSLEGYNGDAAAENCPYLPSSQQDDFFSLSQEKMPEQLSHLESEDGSDLFSRSGENTLKKRESLTAVIQAAAFNVETFGAGDSPEGRANSSGGDIEHFKPIATSVRRPSRPLTAAQLKDRKSPEQVMSDDQLSLRSRESDRRSGSLKSGRTISSPAPSQRSVLSSRRSSRSSVKSHNGRSEQSFVESAGAATPRSSTPGDGTLVNGDLELSPSPVKPAGSSRGDIVPKLRLDDMTGHSEMSDMSEISKLDRTARSRLMSDEFVDQLQREYDELLQKYAQAENTIDQLRLGAKVNLQYNGPPAGQSDRNALALGRHAHEFHLSQGQRAVLSNNQGGLQHTPSGSRTNLVHATSSLSLGGSITPTRDNPGGVPPGNPAEGKLLALQFQAQGQRDRVDSFEILLRENHLPPSDQQRGLEGLKSGQSQLESNYMQAKEEHSTKVRLEGLGGQQATFDPERSLEGQIFQLGMRLDDIQETVEGNLRNNPPEPPTPSRRTPDVAMTTNDAAPHKGSDVERQAEATGVQSLPEGDYSLLLAKYEALKQLPPHPERDREIQELVKSLQNIPNFAVDGDHVSEPPATNGAGFYGNQANNDADEEIALDEAVDDHDGDVDGSSTHSSPFRETTSPDVFRPRGSGHHVLPKWQPPEDGSVSSMGSPDVDPPSSAGTSRKKGLTGKASSKQAQPSGHRSSNPRGDAGDGRRPKGVKSTLAPAEPEGDSGFMGSESSRQSLQTRGSDTRPKNRAQRLPPHSEDIKTAPARSSRLPVKQQRRETQPPPRKNEPVPLRQQAVPEEEDSIYSGGSRMARDRQSRAIPTDYQRKDTRPAVTKPHPAPSHREAIEQRSRTLAARTQPTRRNSPNSSLPLSNQYLSRTSSEPYNGTAMPKRASDQRSEAPSRSGRYDRRPNLPPSQPEFDRRSDVTRSSVRSEALRALQDEVNQLKAKVADARRNPVPPTIPEEASHLHREMSRNYGDDADDAASTRSSKSEMLRMLQEEIADLKEQLDNNDRTSHGAGMPQYATSTPLRDTLRDVLLERYIPRRDESIGASPIRTTSQRYRSPLKRDYLSSIRSPQLSHQAKQSYSRTRGANLSRTSPPPVFSSEQHYRTAAEPSPMYATRTSPCPMCGGSGIHSHEDFQYHPQPSNFSPAPPQVNPGVHGSPAVQPTYQYPQPSTFVPQSYPAAAPQNVSVAPPHLSSTPLVHGQSYVHPHSNVFAPPQIATQPQVSTQQQGGSAYTPGSVPQTGGGPPQVNTVVPPEISSPGQQGYSMSRPLHPEARPVYLIEKKQRGRYYVRDEATSDGEGGEELYYRRTPRSSRKQSRHTSRTAVHSKASDVPMELELSLDDAVHMAQRLQKTTHRLVSTVKRDVQLADSFNASPAIFR